MKAKVKYLILKNCPATRGLKRMLNIATLLAGWINKLLNYKFNLFNCANVEASHLWGLSVQCSAD